MQMLIVIPKLQISLNKLLRGGNMKYRWTCFYKDQEEFDVAVKLYWLENYGPNIHFRGKKVNILYYLYFPTKVKHDYSNYGQKMLDDSLVKTGIIDDDSNQVIMKETLCIRHDKDNPRTEIYIEEA